MHVKDTKLNATVFDEEELFVQITPEFKGMAWFCLW